MKFLKPANSINENIYTVYIRIIIKLYKKIKGDNVLHLQLGGCHLGTKTQEHVDNVKDRQIYTKKEGVKTVIIGKGIAMGIISKICGHLSTKITEQIDLNYWMGWSLMQYRI